MPALFTRISIGVERFAKKLLIDYGTDKSSSFLEGDITSICSSNNDSLIDLPIPLEAPVTKAVLFSIILSSP